MYGEGYKKPTSIFTNLEELQQLCNKCSHRKHSVVLRGSETISVDGKRVSVPKTKNAGAYPYSLCKAWAQILEPFLVKNSRDTEIQVGQCFNDLFSATKTKGAAGKQIQTTAGTDPHFEFIKAAIPEPQQAIAFGQDSGQEVAEKRQRWQQQQKKVDWHKYKRIFHPQFTA